MATPPRRGNGLECRCRSCVGLATQPREVAKSRTDRVRTKADVRDKRNSAKQITVNAISPCDSGPRAKCPLSSGEYGPAATQLVVSDQIPVDIKDACDCSSTRMGLSIVDPEKTCGKLRPEVLIANYATWPAMLHCWSNSHLSLQGSADAVGHTEIHLPQQGCSAHLLCILHQYRSRCSANVRPR